MSQAFIAFARAHGVEITRLDDSGKIRRCGTTEHPRSTNGAYAWDGTGGFVWAWDGEGRAIRFQDPSAPARTPRDEQAARQRALLLRQERDYNQRAAAAKAKDMLAQCKPAEHGYLELKGLKDQVGLVTPDKALFVPMRDIETNALLGAQLIRWLDDERRWEKKYLYGMRSAGAALWLGPRQAPERCLVEGFATGLSVAAAARKMRMPIAVIVTFSAHNLIKVAGKVGGRRYVIADHDAPQRDPVKAKVNPGCAGQLAAAATGLPWALPVEEGMDANDVHKRRGLAALCGLLTAARNAEPHAFVVPPL